jgi:hypothetical protein
MKTRKRVPRLVKIAYGMGYDYVNGKDGAGFPHLTQRDELGHYLPKFRGACVIGIIATLVLSAIAGVVIFVGIVIPVPKANGFFDYAGVAFSCFIILFLIFMIVFLWAYICGEIVGARDKITEVNKKLHNRVKVDKWGEEVKENEDGEDM